jgi:hypothetical protein
MNLSGTGSLTGCIKQKARKQAADGEDVSERFFGRVLKEERRRGKSAEKIWYNVPYGKVLQHSGAVLSGKALHAAGA